MPAPTYSLSRGVRVAACGPGSPVVSSVVPPASRTAGGPAAAAEGRLGPWWHLGHVEVVNREAFWSPWNTKYARFMPSSAARPPAPPGLYSPSPAVPKGGEGRIAQGESASLTRKRSEVQILVRPPT